jgi:hypothetical protein
LIKQFLDIDKGKQLSVVSSHVQPAIDELHSLNFVSKAREYSRIDSDNEKLLSKLSHTTTAIHSRAELSDHWELNKKLLKMLSRKDKSPVEQVCKFRDLYLSKVFGSISSSKLSPSETTSPQPTAQRPE